MHSRLVYLTDFSAHGEKSSQNDQITTSLNAVAGQSPMLKALVIALEQSERRVRDLISSIGQLSVKIERNEVQLWSSLNDSLLQSQQRQDASLAQLTQVVNAVREIAKEVTPAAYRENTVVAALVTQQNRMESALQVMEASYSQFSQSLAQQAQALQRQEQTSLEVLQLRSTVAEQQRGIQQAIQTLGSTFGSLDRVIREHQEHMQRLRDHDGQQTSQLANALREEGEILNRLIERIESLQHEQGAQHERHLVMLTEQLRSSEPVSKG
jgi:chromosome segregation ATPase